MKFLGPIVEKSESFIIGEIFRTSKNSLIYIAKDDREINDIYTKLKKWTLMNTYTEFLCADYINQEKSNYCNNEYLNNLKKKIKQQKQQLELI